MICCIDCSWLKVANEGQNYNPSGERGNICHHTLDWFEKFDQLTKLLTANNSQVKYFLVCLSGSINCWARWPSFYTTGSLTQKSNSHFFRSFEVWKYHNENYFRHTGLNFLPRNPFNRLIGRLMCRERIKRKYKTFLIFDDNPEISYQSKLCNFTQISDWVKLWGIKKSKMRISKLV